jgi:putative transposase
LNGNVLTINKLKLRLKFHLSRPIDGKIQTVCVKRDAVGDWWLSFSIRKEDNLKQIKPMTGKTAGFDFGLKHFLTGNDGQKIDSPQYLFHSISELRRKSRSLSKKTKGSNSRKRAKLELARFHRRISNLRSDFHWKLANKLVTEYDTICLETLNTKAMQQMWGRKIGDLAFAEFVKILSVMCKKHNRNLVQINQWEATSKTCSHCGHREKEMPLNVRKWTCPECGEIHDRDINAAKNILRVGASTLGRGSVRPTP